MWQAWGRRIFEASTSFSNFYRAQCSKAEGRSDADPTAPVWPMPLPYGNFGRKAASLLDDGEFALRRIINLQVAKLNHLMLGEPASAPRRICGAIPLNAGQLSVVERLRRLNGAWSTQAAISAPDLGRTAAKQEQQETVLESLLEFSSNCVTGLGKYRKLIRHARLSPPNKPCGEVIGRVSKAEFSGAQTIVADRIKMEGTPCFDPTPFLDESSKSLYTDPFSMMGEPNEILGAVPRVRVHADFPEKLKLLKLLNKTGRLGFRSPKEINSGFGNGLFCVPKNLNVDRLILDGRPANLLQHPGNRFIMTMGSCTALLGIHLRDDEQLMMSGDDLSNFFYTFKVNYDRCTRNYLEWRVPTYLVCDMHGFPPALSGEPYVYACLNTLAMGDSAACDYAQTSHIAMGLQCGAFDDANILTMHGRVPRANCLAGIIIDDFILLEKVAIDATRSVTMGEKRSAMHAMYNRVGLEAHPTKGFEDEVHGTFWGAQVDGRAGLVQANVARAASLAWVVSQVARLGVCTVGLLEVIAGGFVAIFTFRRRMMSLLDLVYACQSGRDRRDVVRLPPAAVDELWSLAILCPLAVADLRADFCPSVFMVDASNWGEAVVEADLAGDMQAEIHRHGLSRSCWTKLLSPYKALERTKGLLSPESELPEGECCYSEHPIWEVAARGLDYTVAWKCKAKKERHINIGELRAYLKAEALGAARCDGDVRVAVGGIHRWLLELFAREEVHRLLLLANYARV
jgi:hypothetical protein